MNGNAVTVSDELGEYQLVVAGADDHIAKVMHQSGRPYEHRLLALARDLLRPGDAVVDVGANIGNHSVSFARHGARVVAVEANPDAAALLTENVKLNQLGDAVTVEQVGLADEPGQGTVHVRIPGNLGSAAVERGGGGSIQLVRLDDLDVPRPVRLLKIDVEGAELGVLRGGMKLLADDRPLVIVELQTAEARRAAAQLLGPLGYHRFPVSLSGEPTFLFWTERRDWRTVVMHRQTALLAARRVAGRLRHLGRRV